MKDEPLVFFDEAATVTDDDLAKMADILGHTYSGRIPSADIETKAHINRGGAFDKVFAKAMCDAVHNGVGVIEIDSFSQLEERVTAMQIIKGRRGSGKSNLNQMMWAAWDDMFVHTVRHDLKQLQTAQTRTYQGSSDPLFEAMEIHNERMRLGKKAIREMFHATPLNLMQHIHPSKGPVKAKDWE